MILPPRTCLSAARLPVGCAPRRRYPAPAHVTGPRMQPIISIKALGKTYASGFQALKPLDLDIRRGEIFALLGPNGAGKPTLISLVCRIVPPGRGRVTADGHHIRPHQPPAPDNTRQVPPDQAAHG